VKNRRWNRRWRQRIAVAFLLGMAVPWAGAVEPVDVYRFGTAGVGERLTNQFILRNSGTERMEVQSVTPSCDCTQIVQWTTNVEAGATGVVEILFVPDQVGEVDYRVSVKTAASDQPEIEYAIQGIITAAPPARVDRDWTLYVGTEDAEKAIQDPGSTTWVDVRPEEAYARIRIPGSLQIPVYAVKTKEFLKGRRVVLVDEGHGSPVLEAECRKLREMGFSDLLLWPGGLNAWRQLGGTVEGSGAVDIDRVPPSALRHIANATDWLVVDASGGTNRRLDGSVAIPFDASKKAEFVAALNAALEARPQATTVLMATDAGADYGAMAETAGQINAFTFYLEGGWAAWDAHRQMLEAAQHRQTIVSQSTASRAGGVKGRPGGCGGCPK